MVISNRTDIVTTLGDIKTQLGINSAYSHFVDGHDYPYIAYIGDGQSQLMADGTAYWRGNTYQVELYFLRKDEALEADIEDIILANGWNFDKSTDAFIEDEGVYFITYNLS